MAVKIVMMSGKHVEQVVEVHIKAFPEFFLTFLGARFLKELYSSFVCDSGGLGFVAEDSDSGAVIGLVAGALVPEGYFKRLLKRRWWAFCLASITAVLKRPIVIKRLFRALSYRGEPLAGRQRALLCGIAVAPESQGQGIGQALVRRWVEEVKQRGCSGCYLTTDANNNEKINSFYHNLGWKIESTYKTPEGRVMNCYVLGFRAKTAEGAK